MLFEQPKGLQLDLTELKPTSRARLKSSLGTFFSLFVIFLIHV
jgi:hypothetical protein